jgi:hypothetical protein
MEQHLRLLKAGRKSVARIGPIHGAAAIGMPRLRFWLSEPIQQPGRLLDAGEVSRFSRVQFLDVRMALGLRRA